MPWNFAWFSWSPSWSSYPKQHCSRAEMPLRGALELPAGGADAAQVPAGGHRTWPPGNQPAESYTAEEDFTEAYDKRRQGAPSTCRDGRLSTQ